VFIFPVKPLIVLFYNSAYKKNVFRYIEDIRVRGFCPSAEMVPANDPRDPGRTYETGDVVRVAILEVLIS